MSKKQNKKRQPEEESLGKSILDIVITVVVCMAIYFVLFKFVFANETVSGPSMQPTFESNDRIIAVRHSKLQRGDIVILKAPDEPGALYIKRIIGVPGDTIESKNDTLYVNGKKVAEPYLTQYEKKLPKGQLYTNNFTLKKLFGVERVPKDSYFVMGDHRDVSKDSRMIGFIKKSAIVGEVKVRYYPFNQFRFF
ncbi:signal peptidase I [Lactobacillus hominis]|uniref:Signal peptidase I n=1 Tax=Lactobacillus hominis DSM 23910 = CRBIP 24.179 TaxID=1423758 RepID=I7KHZ9_9LACO|nr:signal peptidase I [Lactobacillus hominis]MCT3348445.1 signal peptidase I [Lactobacillus hominis]CCI82570.1 Possible signal peptidase I [Lactobacillus hominis DSM 23910 = CRBIP 24.179]